MSVDLINVHCALIFIILILFLFFVVFSGRSLIYLLLIRMSSGCHRCVRLFMVFTICIDIDLSFFLSLLFIVIIRVLLAFLNALAHPATILLIILAIHDGSGVIGGGVNVRVGEKRLDRGQD